MDPHTAGLKGGWGQQGNQPLWYTQKQGTRQALPLWVARLFLRLLLFSKESQKENHHLGESPQKELTLSQRVR